MYCESDQASLCWDCDADVHGANFLVSKHPRTLICHLCQSPTPWTGSGLKLGPTVSVCESCVDNSDCREQRSNDDDDDDDDDDTEVDTENDGDGENGDGSDGGDQDDDENQVVPGSPSPPPPVSSSSNFEGCSTRFKTSISFEGRTENAETAFSGTLMPLFHANLSPEHFLIF